MRARSCSSLISSSPPRKSLMSAAGGIVIRSERELAGRAGSHHWHLRMPGRPGTLELNEWQNRVWVKVHPLRDGGWATAVAYELAAQAS
jgi:hypothetical protein